MQLEKWVHIFPEGQVNQTGRLLTPLRWGVGKMIAVSSAQKREGTKSPLVIPFYHTGMAQVAKVDEVKIGFPKFGQSIRALFGNPISFDDLINDFVEQRRSRLGYRNLQVSELFLNDTIEERALYSIITKRIEDALLALENTIEWPEGSFRAEFPPQRVKGTRILLS